MFSHRIWYIFPQIDALGVSSKAKTYAIKSVTEAQDYLEHDVLGPRLRNITQAALDSKIRDTLKFFGSPVDALKFKVSLTLFSLAEIGNGNDFFRRALDEFLGTQRKIDLEMDCSVPLGC